MPFSNPVSSGDGGHSRVRLVSKVAVVALVLIALAAFPQARAEDGDDTLTRLRAAAGSVEPDTNPSVPCRGERFVIT